MQWRSGKINHAALFFFFLQKKILFCYFTQFKGLVGFCMTDGSKTNVSEQICVTSLMDGPLVNTNSSPRVWWQFTSGHIRFL